MFAPSQSLQRLLTGAVLRGSVQPISSRGARSHEFECRIEQAACDPQDYQWSFDVTQSVEGGREPITGVAVIRWAGPAPVLSLYQIRLPHQRLIERAEIVLHNGLFAGTWVSDGVRGHVCGVVEHEHASGERAACYVIERSGEALREWWSGKNWSGNSQQARWYEHEPDPARETGDEGAHAAYYPHGVMEPG